MQITLEKLVNSNMAINILEQKSIPVRASFRIARVSEIMECETKRFITAREKLQKQYGGKLSDDRKSMLFPAENQEKIDTDFASLLSMKIDITYPQIKLSELGSDANIEPAIFKILNWLFLDDLSNDNTSENTENNTLEEKKSELKQNE